ncbi:MAG: M23 family metallopeptidase [Thermomicrobiales bacterium]|nr:M23 family metallopeptidase [Thermomicrobiales bacterium]MCO5222707.1 M23 family metallopeptidase [Thermomicrobiales bacterium]
MRFSRRSLLGLLPTLSLGRIASAPAAAQTEPTFALPMGWDGLLPGDGIVIRHAFDVENTSMYPGWWHTGENWYLDFDGNSAGAPIYAVADGVVVFAGSDYPGRVVIIQHDGGIYSMYGHLDYDLLVGEGATVSRSQMIARVLNKTDGRSPSHLHFEMRAFLIESIVNGDAPWYDYACGYQCPPGPGYWPFYSELLPTEVGWLNPLHVLYGRAYGSDIPTDAEVVVSRSGDVFPLRETRTGDPTGTIQLEPGQRLPLLEIATGDEATLETSADAYAVWCKVDLGMQRGPGWIPAVRATNEFVQTDGRPATVRIDLLPG